MSGNTGSVVRWEWDTNAGFSSPTTIGGATTTLSGTLLETFLIIHISCYCSKWSLFSRYFIGCKNNCTWYSNSRIDLGDCNYLLQYVSGTFTATGGGGGGSYSIYGIKNAYLPVQLHQHYDPGN